MNPLSALFKALEAAGIGLDVDAARDAVWLAPHITPDRGDRAVEEPATTQSAAAASASGSTAAATVFPLQTEPAAENGARESTEAPRRPAASGQVDAELTPTAVVLTRVQVPRAAGLAGERGIPGAIRALRRKRRLPSAPIDEAETVRRATEDDLWLPAYQPIADRWLELALVVDHGVSMAVWQEQARDLRRVFTRAAAFRDVRTWSLVSEGEDIGLRRISFRPSDTPTPVRLRSPFGGGRRGLVLVMTDCVSPGWHDGRVLTLLNEWSRQSPVAILQVLPERLWSRTAVGEAARVKLRAVAAATTNPRLHWVADLPLEEAGWRTHGVGVTPNLALFPIVTAAPALLRRLARMVAGVSDEAVDGVLFEMAGMIPLAAAPPMPPHDRVRRFWSVSSNAAAELASILSATPVPSTGVLGLLRRELMPDADASAEAELLFSGLLRVPQDADGRTGDIALEFQEGVRPLLLQSAPVDRVLDTLRRVTAQTAIPGISTPTFDSWIANPSSGEAQLYPGSDPMAAHMASVLEQIGGSYARIVHPEARRGPSVPTPSPADAPPIEQAPDRPVEGAPRESAHAAPRRRPVCFVVMGFGTKVDYATNRTLDLDKSYRLLIKPAVQEAGFECIRADDVIHSGAIDAPLYKHLLEADLVVADLSTSNANAVYQLGIRHGLRPHGTIVIAEKQFRFPFDLGPTAVFQYDHLGTGIDFEETERVRHYLRDAIGARLATPQVDSPVYTFLPELLPGGAPDSSIGRGASRRPESDGRKVCFVTMGFGQKTDYATTRTLDLDKTYHYVIQPAAMDAGLMCVRADEIAHSGNINVPMFQNLLWADVVVADLSTSNVNALYELGVRHALRPNATVVMAEREFRLPFDIGALLILSYEHLGRDIGSAEAMRAREQLTQRIRAGLDSGRVDSPVYVFLPDLRPPVWTPRHDEGERTSREGSGPASISELFRHARNEENWSAAEEYAKELARIRPGDAYPKQQQALAAYKSKKPDPETALLRAKSILEELDPHNTRDPETLGLWGAVHRRLWDLSEQRSDLDVAIDAYRKGFAFKNDYYNGITLVFLLTVRAAAVPDESGEDAQEAHRIRRQVVEICETQLAPRASSDDPAASDERFWVGAALAEAVFGLGDTVRAEEILRTLRAEAPAPWMMDVVDSQLAKLRDLLSRISPPPAP